MLLLVPHKAMLGRHYGHRLHFLLFKVKKGVAEKYFFPTELGPELFFGETRDTILSTGKEIRSPLCYGVLGHGKNALCYR